MDPAFPSLSKPNKREKLQRRQLRPLADHGGSSWVSLGALAKHRSAALPWPSAAPRAIAPLLRTEQLPRDLRPFEVAKDGRMTDAVVGSYGAEGLLSRAAPDQLRVRNKPAKAPIAWASVRRKPGVVRQGAPHYLSINIA
jgi:hypothetical protein